MIAQLSGYFSQQTSLVLYGNLGLINENFVKLECGEF